MDWLICVTTDCDCVDWTEPPTGSVQQRPQANFSKDSVETVRFDAEL